MKFDKIIVEEDGDVATIRLNDPATLNAVTLDMVDELASALDEVRRKSRALILTGAGRGFCAGANLTRNESSAGKTEPQGSLDAGAGLESHINPLMMRLRDLNIPWISAVRGPAAGVGCSLALAADIVVASETAYFLQAFSKVGLVPDGGSSWLLTRAVGRARAMEMMLLGERLPAAKALEWGLISRVVADADVEATAGSIAAGLAAGPTRSLEMIRQACWAATDHDWQSTLATERRLQKAASETADFKEGVAAFREKRRPAFTGR